MSLIRMQKQTAPATPASGRVYLYHDSVSNLWKWKDDDGNIYGFVGAAGAAGPTGPTGPTGPGVPIGGTTGQALVKIDATNYNTQWTTINADKAFTTVAGGTLNDMAIGTGAFRFGTAGAVLRGVVAQEDGYEIVLYNDTASNIPVQHEQTSSAAANRFTTPSGATANIPTKQGLRFKYSTAVSRWILSGAFPYTASSPLTITAANAIGIPNSSASVNGYLSSANFTAFNNKMGGTGVAANIAYFTGASTIAADTDQLSWNETSNRLGVQVSAVNAEAAMHLKSVTTTPLTLPTALGVTLISYTTPGDPSGSSAPSQQPGRLMPATSPSATENSSGASPYNTADTLEYRLSAYHDLGGGDYRECAVPTDFAVVVMVGANNGVDLSWTSNNTGSMSVDGFLLYRSYNGGGYVEYVDVGNVSSFTDDGATFTSGSYNAFPKYEDYIATGVSRDYGYYSREVIGPGPVFSAGDENPATFTDDNSGNPYSVKHQVTTTATLARIIGAADGASFDAHIDLTAGVDYLEYADSWVAGASAHPSVIGYVSDGSVLNRDYGLYKTQNVSGNEVFSAKYGNSSEDPNDSNRYYIQFTCAWPNPSSGAKLISEFDDLGLVIVGGNSATVYDTNNAFDLVDFPTDSNVSPTGIVPAALRVEKSGTPFSDAWFTIKGSFDYSRMDFVDSTDQKQGQIESSTTEMALKYNNTKNIRLNATQLGTYGVTPVTRATTAVASSTFVANTSGILDDTATYDGYKISQIVKALRNLGILT